MLHIRFFEELNKELMSRFNFLLLFFQNYFVIEIKKRIFMEKIHCDDSEIMKSTVCRDEAENQNLIINTVKE